MTTREAIPPLTVDNLPEKQTYEMLESRLMSAEADTKQLLEHLGSLGLDDVKNDLPQKDDFGSKPYETVTPFRGQISEANLEKFKHNYEALVSRVCKNESVLQTLKLNLVNLHGGTSLAQKQASDFKEKLQLTREAYEQEIGKMARQIEYLKDEVATETQARKHAKTEIKELQDALGQASETRMEAAMTAEGLSMSQQKLQRRITELKDQLTREQSLRASLEESHNTLLTRVREMEQVVESERTGVKSMSEDYNHMKVESEMMKGQLSNETKKKQIAESSYKMLCDEKDSLQMQYNSAVSDKQLLITELTRLREQYEDLIRQMEQTQSIIDKQQEIFLADKLKDADKMTELMSRNKELEAEHQSLTDLVRKTASEHDRAISQFKTDLESERQKVSDKATVEDEARRLQDSVRDLTQENQELLRKSKRSEDEVAKLRTRMNLKDEEFTKTTDSMERELESLKDTLKQMTKDKDKVLKDKESLLEEVNQTVDSVVAERAKLQKQVQQLQLELDSHSRARRKLEHENAQLLERLSGFEHQQQAQKHIENTLKEMMEQKNKLAYDNGRLQTQVEQTTIELEGLRKADTEVTKYRQMAETLASKYSQCETEISEHKITIQRLESQLKQSQHSLSSRQTDLSSTASARDDLVKENQKLLTKLQSSEEREKKKVRALQKNNEDAKTVNKEIASTLESVMASHSQLQSVVEGLQIELGKKDTLISRLKNDKNREQQEWKLEMKRFEDRMETLREELRKERDKSTKKTSKDIADIKKQSDNLSTRNMELMKTNTELRHRVRDLEQSVQDQKEKMGDQKRKIEYYHRSKKDIDENMFKMKEMKADIEELENLRDTYIAKNKEQAEMISTFMAQINSLQTELRQLAQAQFQTQDLVNQKERSLQKEKKLREDIRRKYKDSRKREDEIEHMKSSAERRLDEVREESLEISSHLESAHEWFKGKFDTLQNELLSSRKIQEKLEEENTDQRQKLNGERKKAQAAAEKAREMIKESRQTISRLSEYADLADQETKEQLNVLYSQLQSEKDHSKYQEMKHQRYRDASSRQFEKLLQETDMSYS